MGKKKKKRIFYPVYFTLIVLFFIAVAIGCVKLNGYLKDYQRSDSRPAVEEAFSRFTSLDIDTLAGSCDWSAYPNEDIGDYRRWLQEYVAGAQPQDFTYKALRSEEKDKKKFSVKLRGESFGTFTIREIPNSTEYGFSTWEFDSVEVVMPQATEYSVTVPAGYSVTADGERLTEPSETGIASVWTGHMLKEETKAPSFNRYTVERTFGVPQFEVTDLDGRSVELTEGENGPECAFSSDTRLADELTGRVKKIASVFSAFTSADVSRGEVLGYARKGTNAYEVLEKFDNDWFGSHSSAWMDNFSADNFIRFTDDTAACDVHYDYTAEFSAGTKVYETNYRFYLVLRDDVWYLYDFTAL